MASKDAKPTSAWPEGKAPATLHEFYRCLEASRACSAEEARQFVEGLPEGKRPDTPKAVAIELIKAAKLTRFQAQAVLTGKVKYLSFGEYVVLERLGRGGMGEVLKAEHRRMQRTVALKVISGSAMKDADAVRRFQREVHAAARLIHPNIVTAFDANEHEGVHFLVMEFADGRDLAAVVHDQGPLPVATAIDFVLQAARGLAYAHGKGIVHRDIKPGNLLVDRDGTVKILDMGLARIDLGAGSSLELTSTGQVMGTVDYMAPEQAEDTHSADARADIYSLGCTLYRLLSGEVLYGGESVVKKLLAHRSSPIPPLSAVCPSAPATLDATFRKMVAKRPEDRQQSMTQVVSELEAILRGQAAKEPTVGSTELTTDLKLSEFFAAIGPRSGKSSPTPTVKKSVTQVASGTEVTQDFAKGDTTRSGLTGLASAVFVKETGNRGQGTAKKVGRRPLRGLVPPYVIAIAAALGGLALAAAGIVVFLPTNAGTIRVEINDPSIEVTVSGSGYKIKGKSEEIHVKPGDHTLHVKTGELEFDTGKFVLGKGENPPLKVELLPGKVQVVRSNGQLLGQRDRPPPIAATTKSATPASGVSTASVGTLGGAVPLPAIAPFDAAAAKKHQESWAVHLGLPVEFTNSIGMKFRLIPPGEFLMGSTAEERRASLESSKVLNNSQLINGIESEEPRHRVTLSRPFYLGTCEVTQQQYRAITGSNPSYHSPTGQNKDVVAGIDTAGYPVEGVTWHAAAAFCTVLAQRDKLPWQNSGSDAARLQGENTYRLPTEAEWEYACRAGTTTTHWTGNDAEGVKAASWLSQNKPHPVGQLTANPWGLFDMHGNVMEWCQDGWRRDDYQRRQEKGAIDPLGAASQYHVIRGSHYVTGASYARSAFRFGAAPDTKQVVSPLGFRVAISIPTSAAGAIPSGGLARSSVSDWANLFNGRDLYGWLQKGHAGWSVKDGVLTGESVGAVGWLMSEKEYGDFELELEYRLPPGGNSGVFLRAPESGNISGGDFNEIQLLDDASPKFANVTPQGRNGALFSQIAATKAPIKAANEWRKLLARVVGTRVQVTLDGVEVIDGPLRAGTAARGHVGLQLYAPGIAYRNIRLRELGTTLPATSAITAPNENFALAINGAGEYASYPNPYSDYRQPLTLEIWVRPAELSTNAYFFAAPSSLTLKIQKINDPRLPEYVWQFVGYAPDGKLYGTTSRVAPAVGEWAHLAGVWESNNLCLYVNGELHYKLAVPDGLRAPKAGEPFFTGPPPPQARGFRGEIDEIRLSKIARYTANFTPERRFKADADTLALYHLNEGQGSVAGDASGNGHHGQIVGAKWVPGIAGGATVAASANVANYALDVAANGAAQAPYVELPLVLDYRQGLTVEVTLASRTASSTDVNHGIWRLQLPDHNLLDLKQRGNDLAWGALMKKDGASQVDEFFAVTAINAMQPGQRLRLATVFTANELRLFVDGLLAQARPLKRQFAPVLPARQWLGFPDAGTQGWMPFDGTIDEIRISTIARYERDYAPVDRLDPDKDTWALYHCDEGRGDVLTDSSGNNHDGKIVGAKWVRSESP